MTRCYHYWSKKTNILKLGTININYVGKQVSTGKKMYTNDLLKFDLLISFAPNITVINVDQGYCSWMFLGKMHLQLLVSWRLFKVALSIVICCSIVCLEQNTLSLQCIIMKANSACCFGLYVLCVSVSLVDLPSYFTCCI